MQRQRVRRDSGKERTAGDRRDKKAIMDMKKGIIIGLLAVIGLLPMHAEVKYMTTSQFKKEVFDYEKNAEWKYQGKRPMVIDFYTTWCGPCKRLAPIMEELSEKYKGKVDFYKIDIERDREPANRFDVTSIPQVLYVPMNGKPQKLIGLYPKEQIEEIIDQFLLKKSKKK